MPEIETCERCGRNELKENNRMIKCFLCGKTICHYALCTQSIYSIYLDDRSSMSTHLITVDINRNKFDHKSSDKYICKEHIEETFESKEKGNYTYREPQRERQLKFLKELIDKLIDDN